MGFSNNIFTDNNIPEGDWRSYIKIVPTSMLRIEGGFHVETDEGVLYCEDGFLAKDARGHLYPINIEEHELIYREVSND